MAGEMDDFLVHGVLRGGPNGMTGKHLATSLEDAQQWGAALASLTDDTFSGVLSITVSDDVAAGFLQLGRIDNIGQAVWANLDELANASIKVIN